MGVVIIGGGVAGLSAAYWLTQAGHQVTLFEKESELGGLARSFKIGHQYLERYYHFICLNDEPLLGLIEEMACPIASIGSIPGWGNSSSGCCTIRRAMDLLTFRPFSLLERLRFGFNIMHVKSQSRTLGASWRTSPHPIGWSERLVSAPSRSSTSR